MRTRPIRAAAGIPSAAVVALVCACASIQVQSDWDPEQDFSTFQRYAWLAGPQPETGDIRVDNPLLDRRIRATIDRVLAERGYERVDREQADFLVGYHLSVESKLDTYTVNHYYGYGYRGRWGPYGSIETRTREYDVGTLVIDVATARENRHVWRGSGMGRVSGSKTPEQSEARLHEAVSAILARFPPPGA